MTFDERDPGYKSPDRWARLGDVFGPGDEEAPVDPRTATVPLRGFDLIFAQNRYDTYVVEQAAKLVAQQEGHGDEAKVRARWNEEALAATVETNADYAQLVADFRARAAAKGLRLPPKDVPSPDVPKSLKHQARAREHMRVIAERERARIERQQAAEQQAAAMTASEYQFQYHERYGRWPTLAQQRAAGVRGLTDIDLLDGK